MHALDGKLENGILEKIGSDWKLVNGVLYKNCKVVRFEGDDYIVSDKATLTIQMTGTCNANCGFCFNGITFYPNNNNKGIPMGLSRVLDFCVTSEIESVAISGGEPTVDVNSLMQLVELIAGKFKDYKIHSNGLNLFKFVQGATLVEYLIWKWINKITLSLAHFDFEKNRELMNFRWKFAWLRAGELNQLWSLADRASIRLSCFLCAEGIYKNEDIQKYVEHGVANGIHNFIFRTAWSVPSEFLKDTNHTDFCEKNILNMDERVRYFTDVLWYTEAFSLHKSDIYVYVLKKNGITIDFERSSEERDPDEKIRRINVFGNGVSYTSWIDPTQLLFKDDKSIIIAQTIQWQNRVMGNFPAAAVWKTVLSRMDHALNPNAPLPVDMHVHSFNSDGNMTVEQVMIRAKAFWVKILTFTEHNFISWEALKEARLIWEKTWIQVPFAGVEINVVTTPDWKTPDRKHHMLAYGDLLMDSQFQEIISRPNRNIFQYYWNILEDIKMKYGFCLPSLEDMMKWLNEMWEYMHPEKRLITRSVIAQYIQKLTWEDVEIIKANYLPPLPKGLTYANYNRAEDIIPMVNELWGVCWLAHPGWDRPYSEWGPGSEPNDVTWLLSEIWRLKRLGLDGIEINHKSHTPAIKSVLQRFSSEIFLINVGGSDYHAKPKSKPEHIDINPGTFGLTMLEYEKIANRIR